MKAAQWEGKEKMINKGAEDVTKRKAVTFAAFALGLLLIHIMGLLRRSMLACSPMWKTWVIYMRCWEIEWQFSKILVKIYLKAIQPGCEWLLLYHPFFLLWTLHPQGGSLGAFSEELYSSEVQKMFIYLIWPWIYMNFLPLGISNFEMPIFVTFLVFFKMS